MFIGEKMLKKGFTLAEVLITLSIIGVISALTIPALIQDTAEAEVEPKLNKTQTALIQANKKLLYDYGVDRISETGYFQSNDAEVPVDTNAHMDELTNHMKLFVAYNSDDEDVVFGDVDGMHVSNTKYYTLSDGVAIAFKSNLMGGEIDKTTKPHKAQIGTYIVDINGRTKPNKLNEDIFYFTAYDDGSARRQ